MSQDETPNELDAWLLRHGFTRQETTNVAAQTPKSVFEVVHELCDCVQNLFSLEFQVLINAGLKVGVARTLLATIKSENENVKQLCALAEPKNPQQIIVAQIPILESSVDGRKNTTPGTAATVCSPDADSTSVDINSSDFEQMSKRSRTI